MALGPRTRWIHLWQNIDSMEKHFLSSFRRQPPLAPTVSILCKNFEKFVLDEKCIFFQTLVNDSCLEYLQKTFWLLNLLMAKETPKLRTVNIVNMYHQKRGICTCNIVCHHLWFSTWPNDKPRMDVNSYFLAS